MHDILPEEVKKDVCNWSKILNFSVISENVSSFLYTDNETCKESKKHAITSRLTRDVKEMMLFFHRLNEQWIQGFLGSSDALKGKSWWEWIFDCLRTWFYDVSANGRASQLIIGFPNRISMPFLASNGHQRRHHHKCWHLLLLSNNCKQEYRTEENRSSSLITSLLIIVNDAVRTSATLEQ